MEHTRATFSWFLSAQITKQIDTRKCSERGHSSFKENECLWHQTEISKQPGEGQRVHQILQILQDSSASWYPGYLRLDKTLHHYIIMHKNWGTVNMSSFLVWNFSDVQFLLFSTILCLVLSLSFSIVTNCCSHFPAVNFRFFILIYSPWEGPHAFMAHLTCFPAYTFLNDNSSSSVFSFLSLVSPHLSSLSWKNSFLSLTVCFTFPLTLCLSLSHIPPQVHAEETSLSAQCRPESFSTFF